MNMLLILFAVFLASFFLTWFVRSFSIRKAIFDVPNERSSHQIPTPRGGGIAIALTFFFAVCWLAMAGMISLALAKALVGGGLIIAATGYWDDLRSISAAKRAVLHFLAAGWALYCLGGFPVLVLGNWQIHWGWFGSVFAAVGIVWLINLYNFMDGIDGIAGVEAVFVSLVGGCALYLLGAHGLAWVCFFLFAAVLGFLLWNWPPAKIFLGDVGSGLLGYIFAVIALASANQQMLPLLFWLVLLAVFICDATFTLLHRMKRGERWYSAHREHVYQRLTQHGVSHQRVTLLVTVVNLAFILPIFYWIVRQPNFAPWLFLFVALGFFVVWRQVIAQDK